MAIFDILYTLPYMVSTVAIPAYVEGGDPSGVLGAVGNQGSCRAQGFFVALGNTTFFYNVSLAVYYKLVIVNGWTERRLRKIRSLLIGIPCLFGAIFAFSGLPYYTWSPIICFVNYFPLEDSLGVTLGFMIIPVSLSILTLTGIMVSIYFSVRTKTRRSSTYQYGTSRSTTVQEKVFWQSLSYVIAFMITWPTIMVGALVAGAKGNLPYWFGLLLSLIAPFQGFINAVVYFRPRIGLFVFQIMNPISKMKQEEEKPTMLVVTDEEHVGDENRDAPIVDREDDVAAPQPPQLEEGSSQPEKGMSMKEQRQKMFREQQLSSVQQSQEVIMPQEMDAKSYNDEMGNNISTGPPNRSNQPPMDEASLAQSALEEVSLSIHDRAFHDSGSILSADEERLRRRNLHIMLDPSLAILEDPLEDDEEDGTDFTGSVVAFFLENRPRFRRTTSNLPEIEE